MDKGIVTLSLRKKKQKVKNLVKNFLAVNQELQDFKDKHETDIEVNTPYIYTYLLTFFFFLLSWEGSLLFPTCVYIYS